MEILIFRIPFTALLLFSISDIIKEHAESLLYIYCIYVRYDRSVPKIYRIFVTWRSRGNIDQFDGDELLLLLHLSFFSLRK